MKIEVNHRVADRLGFSYRLWLDNYYQDMTIDDLKKLKAAVDAVLSPPKRGKK